MGYLCTSDLTVRHHGQLHGRDRINLDGWTPDVADNGSSWEVLRGAASVQDNALALSRSGTRPLALLDARNVIEEIEFDFTLGGYNTFWFFPRRDADAREGHKPHNGFGFWVARNLFDFKKFTDGVETRVRAVRKDSEPQSTYTAKFVVAGDRRSLYIKEKGEAYGPDLLNVMDSDYRYLTHFGFARSGFRNDALRIDNVRVIVDPRVRDRDGDGVADPGDAFPRDPTETVDTDGDGTGDNSDAFPRDPAEWADSDGDRVGDNTDAFPSDPLEDTDTDTDGIGNNADWDDDNDGIDDVLEDDLGTNPLNADTDNDGLDDGFEFDERLNPLDGSDCPDWICGVTRRGWRLGL